MVSQILRMVSQIQAGPAGGRKEYLPPGGGGKGYCSPPAGGGTEGVRTGGRTPSPPTIVPPLLPGGVRREYQGRPQARSRGGAARCDPRRPGRLALTYIVWIILALSLVTSKKVCNWLPLHSASPI